MLKGPRYQRGFWAALGSTAQYWAPAAASLLGGMLGRQSNKEVTSAQLQQQQAAMENAVRWRVEDAKHAGVSPLYALGASVSQPAPISVMQDPMADAVRDMGQQIGNASRNYTQQKVEIANLEAIAAATKRDNAQAAYWEAQAAKTAQELNGKPALPSSQVVSVKNDVYGTQGVKAYPVRDPYEGLKASPLYEGAVELKAAPQMSRDVMSSDTVAGRPPAWQKYQIGVKSNGEPVYWYAPVDESGSFSQATQDMPLGVQLMMIYKNLAHQWDLRMRQKKSESRLPWNRKSWTKQKRDY